MRHRLTSAGLNTPFINFLKNMSAGRSLVISAFIETGEMWHIKAHL